MLIHHLRVYNPSWFCWCQLLSVSIKRRGSAPSDGKGFRRKNRRTLGCFNSAVHIHRLRFAPFASPVKSDGCATLFFALCYHYALVIVRNPWRTPGLSSGATRRWGAEPPLVYRAELPAVGGRYPLRLSYIQTQYIPPGHKMLYLIRLRTFAEGILKTNLS